MTTVPVLGALVLTTTDPLRLQRNLGWSSLIRTLSPLSDLPIRSRAGPFLGGPLMLMSRWETDMWIGMLVLIRVRKVVMIGLKLELTWQTETLIDRPVEPTNLIIGATLLPGRTPPSATLFVGAKCDLGGGEHDVAGTLMAHEGEGSEVDFLA